MKKIIILSHCILNKASKVEMDESDLAEEYQVRDALLKQLIEQDIQIVQLPCPEFFMYGSQRWGHVKNQFQHPYYQETCKTLLHPILLQLSEYAAHPESFLIMGIVSVEGSPSCGYKLTCTGDKWKGEIGTDASHIREIQQSLVMAKEPGVFMQMIEEELKKYKLQIPIHTMDEMLHILTSDNSLS